MHVLPTKFESILRTSDLNFGPLILKVDSDLRRFRSIARFNQAPGAGGLAVLESPPGKGKTTAVYAASVLLRDHFHAVLPVLPQLALPLRELPKWFAENLPPASEKVTPVLIDGRESTDDEQGLRDVMAVLNNFVRGRPDLLFVWPTTDPAWRDHLVATARNFGSQSFCPDQAVLTIDGPGRDQWVEAVALILDQLGASWDEFGINESTAAQLVDDYPTLGEFFTGINGIRVAQEEFAGNVTGLPEVVFVVSSHSEIVGHVARLRNPASYRLRTDEVIGSARMSEPGKFWKSRGSSQSTNLAWVSSLLQAKLVSLTPSTVAHACALETSSDSRIRQAVIAAGFSGSRSTGLTAYRTTDLARFLAGEPVPEVLTKNKGKTSAATLAAFDAAQSLSSKKHREINEALLKFIAKGTKAFDFADVLLEVPLGDDAIVDAIVPLPERRLHFEFHHLSGANCNPNKIATYMMRKLRVYATQYNLIER